MKRICFLVIALTSLASLLHAGETIRFGVPPWPGVTVKSEVVTQIMEAMGYETEQEEVGPPIIYKSMSMGDMDVFLGAWIPHQNDMLNPLVSSGAVETANLNLSDCAVGLCVPEYVWEAGVQSMADLDAHGVQFKKRVYNIEAGTGMNTELGAILENDVAGLGDWEQIGSTTSAMLSEVKGKMVRNEWVAFGCWSPHWMTIEFDIRFLKGVPGTEKFTSESKVYSVVNKDFSKKYPELFRFLQQFTLTAEIQSEWIYAYGFRKEEPPKVAKEWIAGNMDTVARWLEGVKGKNGTLAIDCVKKAMEK